MEKSLISIIVCIYNKEKYLSHCLDSLINQTYQNIEILCIDDGSKDGSLQICNNYADKDNRIKVHHQENQGVALARQKGMELSKGEWIIYCDPDDWMESNMVSSLIHKANDEDADFVWCDFYVDENEKRTTCSQYVETSEYWRGMLCGLLNSKILGAMWNKLIRKSVIQETKVTFDRNLTALEDWTFLIGLLVANSQLRMAYINSPLYHYTQYNESIMHSMDVQKTYDNYTYAIKVVETLLPVEKYGNLLFYKKIVLGCLFKMGKYKEMHATYPEIHQNLLNEMSWSDKMTLYALAIMGHSKLGMLIEKVKSLLKKYKQK